jgi:hypothetical protein
VSGPSLIERLRSYQDHLIARRSIEGLDAEQLHRDLGIAVTEIEVSRREAEASRSKRSDLRGDL